MLEGIKTDHKCPECGKTLQYDMSIGTEDGNLTINVYCEDEDCDYYDWRNIDPIAKEIYS